MLCVRCRKGELEAKKAEVEGEVHGERFNVECAALVCPLCKYTTIGAEQIQDFMRLLADAYRYRHGLLTGSDIRRMRKALDWSQTDLASRTGVGLASVKRWELGKIQDDAMDKLLRLYLDPDHARRHAKEMGQAQGRIVVRTEMGLKYSHSENRNQMYKPFPQKYLPTDALSEC